LALLQKTFNRAIERLRQPLFSWRTSLHFCNGKIWVLDHAERVSERVGHRGNAYAFADILQRVANHRAQRFQFFDGGSGVGQRSIRKLGFLAAPA
jgi:hypothetical protein